ncbi:MAG: hypothetical protein JJT96_05430 [Opitutales bacterium]|nr:hypothetical protein [Opitutales bacterium]
MEKKLNRKTFLASAGAALVAVGTLGGHLFRSSPESAPREATGESARNVPRTDPRAVPYGRMDV